MPATKYKSEAKLKGEYQGWSTQGRKRYNELVKKVEEDRESLVGKAVEMEYLRVKQERVDQGRYKKKIGNQDDDDETDVECIDELE